MPGTPFNYRLRIQHLVTSGTYTHVGSFCLAATVSRKRGSLWEPLSIGQATFTLDNADGRWSPDNPDSPYFPDKFRLGAEVNFDTDDPDTTSTPGLFRGLIDTITVDPSPDHLVATIRCSDRKVLKERLATLAIRVNDNPGSLLRVLLMSGAGLAATAFTIDPFLDTFPFAWYRDAPVDRALDEVLQAVSGYSYVRPFDRDIVLKNRYWPVLSTIVSSYVNAFQRLEYRLDDEEVVNRARIESEPRKIAASAGSVAWLQQPLLIPGSAWIGFELTFVDPDSNERDTPCTSMVTPVKSLDYQANTQTTAPPPTWGDKTATLSATVAFRGVSAICSVFNGAPEEVWLHTFVLRGTPIQRQATILAQAEDSSSQVLYGVREWVLRTTLLGDPNYAADYAVAVKDDRKNPRPDVTMTLKNTWPDICIRELGDLIFVAESNTAIGSQFLITGIHHQIRMGRGIEHTAEYELELFRDPLWLVLDDPVKGKLDNRTLAF